MPPRYPMKLTAGLVFFEATFYPDDKKSVLCVEKMGCLFFLMYHLC